MGISNTNGRRSSIGKGNQENENIHAYTSCGWKTIVNTRKKEKEKKKHGIHVTTQFSSFVSNAAHEHVYNVLPLNWPGWWESATGTDQLNRPFYAWDTAQFDLRNFMVLLKWRQKLMVEARWFCRWTQPQQKCHVLLGNWLPQQWQNRAQPSSLGSTNQFVWGLSLNHLIM